MAHPRCSARACPQGPPPHPFVLEGPAAPSGPASTASGGAPGRVGQRPGCGGFAKGRSTWGMTQRARPRSRGRQNTPRKWLLRKWMLRILNLTLSDVFGFTRMHGDLCNERGGRGGPSTNRHLHARVLGPLRPTKDGTSLSPSAIAAALTPLGKASGLGSAFIACITESSSDWSPASLA